MNRTNHASGESNDIIQPPKINVFVSADKMIAYIRVTLSHKEQLITKEQIMEALDLKEVNYGILYDEIEAFCKSKRYHNETAVANGLRPKKGENGAVEFHFRTKITGMAMERADGTVDYKKLDIIQNVKKGDVLCTITQPLDGTDGIDVFGNTVKARKGDMPNIPGGEHVELSEDSKFIYAKIDGGISFKNGVINIEEIYTVRTDVGLSTGNIDFNGSVVVRGNVLEGFSVTAKKNITIHGMVEGAVLNAGESILVKGGISGMGKAVVTAEGSVTSTFIENAAVNCGGDLYSDVILNGDINAGGSIVLSGKKGTIIGGTYRAGGKICANVIGNATHITQNVIIDPCWYELEKREDREFLVDPDEKKESLLSKRKSLNDFLEGEALLEQPNNDELSVEERKKRMHESLAKKTKIKRMIAQIDNQLKEIDQFWSGRDFTLVCLREIFPGTRIAIGNAKMRVNQQLQNQRFYLYEGEISVGPVLPHQRQ